MENDKLTVVSGCAGIGGIDLGLRWTNQYKTVCYVERDSYCQAVLLKEMQKGNMDIAPIWDDFTTFDGGKWRGVVDLFAAGIPCQPHSLAGQRRGKCDERNLWPDMARITWEMEPRYVLVENVPGLFTGQKPYGLEIIGQLQAMGYLVFKFNLSAEAVGANHKRERVFILGVKMANSELCRRIHPQAKEYATKDRKYAQRNTITESADVPYPHLTRSRFNELRVDENKQAENQERRREKIPELSPGCADVSYTDAGGLQRQYESKHRSRQPKENTGWGGWWATEPDVGRVAHGIPSQVDRLKCLGNAVVPQVAYKIGTIILRIERGLKGGDANINKENPGKEIQL